MATVSIIIPVNKRFDLLKNQIDSLSKHVFVLEIIVVLNNASMTKIEVKKLFENHQKVKILECTSGFANSARKIGVEAALGEYIVFSDADDYYVEQGLQLLLDEIEKGYDFVQGEIGLFRDNNLKSWHRLISTVVLSTRKDILKNSKLIRPNFYGKIFRRSVVVSTSGIFLDLRITQDWNAIYKLCYNSKRAKIISNRVYVHVVHPGTITQNTNLGDYYVSESSRGLQDLLTFCINNGTGSNEEIMYRNEIMLRFLVNCVRVCKRNNIDYLPLNLPSYDLVGFTWRALYLRWIRFNY